MNKIERESIILNCAWEMIDDMVNWAMFAKNDRTEPTDLRFETHRHQRLFIILLGDFLSEVRGYRGPPPLGLEAAPSNAPPSDLTFIFHLRQVCADPKLGADATGLSARIEAFANWLEGDFVAHGVNLHAIDIVADLRVRRWRYIKMCGDIAKHNLARLESNVKHLRKILEDAGHPVSEQEGYLAIKNFFDWFHDDVFSYHASHIEFMNEIRWEIFTYLRIEFGRSWHLTGKKIGSSQLYSYDIPSEISEPVARAMYWDLMNRVRAKPLMHRLVVHEYCKNHY